MNRKKFIGIIGWPKNGKTTIIRSLTGYKFMDGHGYVVDKESSQKLYVIAGSPQESGMDIETFRAILKQVAADDNCLGIASAIQPNKPTKTISMEDMFKCIEEFLTFEPYTYVLSPVYDGKMSDVNEIFRRLSPYNAGRITEINSKEFAFLNASKIQTDSNILGIVG